MNKPGVEQTEHGPGEITLLEELWQIESREVLQMLDPARGGIALQIAGPLGSVRLAALLPRAATAQLVVAGEKTALSAGDGITGLPQLPVRTASLDSVVVLHALEQLAKPMPLIDEIERVLVEDGELIIAGFNPYSLFGLFSRNRQYDITPYRHSPAKVRQWLDMTDLQVERVVSNYFRPPITSSRWRGRTELLDRLGLRLLPNRGALYVLRARKRTYRITPVGIDFAAVRQLGVGGLPTAAREGLGQSRDASS